MHVFLLPPHITHFLVRWNPSLKRHEFLVNWLGWSAKDNSYEP